jgi:DNA-binding MarR family transcriptional regulator
MTSDEDAWVESLVQALNQLVRDVRQSQLFTRMGELADIGLSEHLFLVFARLGEMSPVRIADLAAAMEVDRSTISRQIAELTEAGYASKEVDRWDRRSVTVSITPDGEAALAKLWGSWSDTLADATKSWSVTDRRRFLVLMRRLTNAVEDFMSASPTRASR